MDTNIEKIPTTPPDEITWEDDLKKVGLLRRLLRARKWYGADWWFVAISSLAVLFFILVAIFPSWFAPYTPDTLVGPRFLAPNEIPAVSVLIAPSDSTISSLKDLAVDENADRPKVAVVMYAATGDATQFSAEQIDIALKQWRGQPTQEPEVMEHLAVWTYQMIGHENLWFPRFYAILFWLIGGLGLYFFLRDLTGPTGAVIGTVFFLFCPYGISASRAFMVFSIGNDWKRL